MSQGEDETDMHHFAFFIPLHTTLTLTKSDLQQRKIPIPLSKTDQFSAKSVRILYFEFHYPQSMPSFSCFTGKFLMIQTP